MILILGTLTNLYVHVPVHRCWHGSATGSEGDAGAGGEGLAHLPAAPLLPGRARRGGPLPQKVPCLSNPCLLHDRAVLSHALMHSHMLLLYFHIQHV